MKAAARRQTDIPLAQVTPMLCSLVSDPIDTRDWIYESKFDGLRVLVQFDGEKIDLISRNHKCQNFQFPDVVKALKESLEIPIVLDGEIVCLDEKGQSSFRALQQRFHLTNAKEVEARIKRYPAYLYVFDLLSLNGEEVM